MDPSRTASQPIKFNFHATAHQLESMSSALRRLLPRVMRERFAVGHPGLLVTVAYPDFHVMEAMLPRIGGEEEEEGGVEDEMSWKPYAVCASAQVAPMSVFNDKAVPSFPENHALLGLGYFNDDGEICAAYTPAHNPGMADMPRMNALLMELLPRTMVDFEVPADTDDDFVQVLRGLSERCARCACTTRPTFRRCAGCGVVAFCSAACEEAMRHRHSSQCLGAAIMHRTFDPCSPHNRLGDDCHFLTLVPLPPHLQPARRLTLAPNGWFDDSRRSALMWDVTEPPSEARLLPGCLSPFRAWRRGFRGERITPMHLAATVPSGGVATVDVTYFDVRVRVNGTTLLDLMDAVYRALLPHKDRDADHRRFDHFMKRGFDADERWLLQLGGSTVHHRGNPWNDYHLYDVTLLDRVEDDGDA